MPINPFSLSFFRPTRRSDFARFKCAALANYNRNCAVTGPKFVYSATVEADAAHIIAKGNKGTDDPPQRARAVEIRPLGLRPWPTKSDTRSRSGFREWVDEDDRPGMQADRSAGRNADQAPDNPACCR